MAAGLFVVLLIGLVTALVGLVLDSMASVQFGWRSRQVLLIPGVVMFVLSGWWGVNMARGRAKTKGRHDELDMRVPWFAVMVSSLGCLVWPFFIWVPFGGEGIRVNGDQVEYLGPGIHYRALGQVGGRIRLRQEQYVETYDVRAESKADNKSERLGTFNVTFIIRQSRATVERSATDGTLKSCNLDLRPFSGEPKVRRVRADSIEGLKAKLRAPYEYFARDPTLLQELTAAGYELVEVKVR